MVGDVRLRQRQVPGGRSVEHAREVEHPQRLRARHHDEADERADLADEQHRLAADAIRHVTDDRPRHELARREHRHQHRRLQRRRVERLGVDRQQRNDERHAEDVDQNDEEDGKERNALWFVAGTVMDQPVMENHYARKTACALRARGASLAEPGEPEAQRPDGPPSLMVRTSVASSVSIEIAVMP